MWAISSGCRCISGNNISIFTLLVIVAAGLSTCSANRVDPVAIGNKAGGFGGWLTSGADGPNQIVQNSNRLILSNGIFAQIYSAYEKSISALSPPPTWTNTVRFLGGHKGHAVVQIIDDTPDSLKNNTTFYYHLSITFYDYSDSRKFFIGGQISLLTLKKLNNNNKWVQEDILLEGGLVFAGDYSGSIEFESFLMLVNSASSHLISGNVVIRSGEEILSFNPYSS